MTSSFHCLQFPDSPVSAPSAAFVSCFYCPYSGRIWNLRFPWVEAGTRRAVPTLYGKPYMEATDRISKSQKLRWVLRFCSGVILSITQRMRADGLVASLMPPWLKVHCPCQVLLGPAFLSRTWAGAGLHARSICPVSPPVGSFLTLTKLWQSAVFCPIHTQPVPALPPLPSQTLPPSALPFVQGRFLPTNCDFFKSFALRLSGHCQSSLSPICPNCH